jgi:hypothetical protein
LLKVVKEWAEGFARPRKIYILAGVLGYREILHTVVAQGTDQVKYLYQLQLRLGRSYH